MVGTSKSLQGIPTLIEEVPMYQSPQQPGPTRVNLSPTSARLRARWLSTRAQIGQTRLDRELASGANPDSDPLLQARARHLLSRDAREQIASTIDRILRPSDRAALYSARVPVCSPAVREAEPALAMLADRLRAYFSIDAQGVAKAQILLTDGSGPLYNPNSTSDVNSAAHGALAALDVRPTGSTRSRTPIRSRSEFVASHG